MKRSKKNKIAALLLGTALTAAGCGFITACQHSEGDNSHSYSLDMWGVYAYAQEAGYTGTYEELVSLVKGEKGDMGASVKSVSLDKDGYLVFTLSDGSTAKTDKPVKDGINGKDGAYVTGAELDSDGFIVFTLSDGNTVKTDKALKDGKDGNDGVSVIGADFDADGKLVLTLSNGTTTSTDKAIKDGKDGKDGEDGKDGASVKSVTVDNDGYVVFTLTNGATTKTDKTLIEILNMHKQTCTVSYYYLNGTAKGEIQDADYNVRYDEVTYGEKLSDPLEAYTGEKLSEFLGDIDFALGAQGYKFTSWYYLNSDGEPVKYDFNQPVIGNLNLYVLADGKNSYSISYEGFEGATVYGKYDKLDSFKYGDVLPSIAAYKRFTEDEVEKLSVFTGWAVNGKTANNNVITTTGDIKVSPIWKTVNYGYISEGLYLGADGVVSATNAAGTNDTTTGNTSIYGNTATDKSTLDDLVIISGDDVTALTTGKYFQGNGTTGVAVKHVYIVAPNLKKVVAPTNHNTVQTSATSLVAFQSMPECESVVIAADAFQQFGSIFKNSPKLKMAALDYKMTNGATPVDYFELRGSTFSGCTALETVYIKTQVTTFGTYEFENCYTFDVVNNFGWDYLNKVASIGYACFKANETFEELIIDGEHFSGLASGKTLNQMFSSDNPFSTTTRNKQNIKSVRIEMFGSFSFSMSMQYLSTKLESVELYLPNATGVTLNTQNCPVGNIRVYAPKATSLSGTLSGSKVESLYVTSDRAYKGDEDAIFVVGKLTATGAFNECTSLKTAEFDVPTIETVSSNLFNSSRNLTRVEFKSGDIRNFGTLAFGNCNKLRAVICPDLDASDTRMYRSSGSDAYPTYTGIHQVFGNCYALEYLSNYDRFGKMLAVVDTSLGQNGFGFPKDAKVFTQTSTNGFYFCGTTIFRYDESVMPANGEVVIPANATAIAQKAFSGMAVKKISFAKNSKLVTLGNSAFANCAELTTVDMTNATLLESDYNSSVYGSGNSYWFQNCEKLSSVTLSTSTGFTTIGDYTFQNCPALTSLTIPANITKIRSSAFADNSNMQNLTFAGAAPQLTLVDSYLFSKGKNVNATAIFKAICDATVKPTSGDFTTPDRLFYNCAEITSVEIPAAYTKMAERVFDGCTKLASVTFETGTQIKDMSASGVFSGTAITSFTVPESTVKTPDFSNLKTLTSVTFENGCPNLTHISALNGTAISNITVPANVTTLGSFEGCDKLETITFTDGCTSLTEMSSFKNCNALTSITIPENFGDNKTYSANRLPSFEGCTQLASVTFANGCPKLLQFNSSVFKNCTSLKEITIPANVTTLGGGNSFQNCTSLESVVFASNEKLTTGGNYTFGGCTALSKITVEGLGYNTLPKNLKSVSSWMFQNCTSLRNFTFQKPDSGCVSMGSYAFQDCLNLEWVSVPSDTSYSYDTSFSGCTKLSTVIITAGSSTEVKNGTSAFTNSTRKNTPWYVRAKAGVINILISNGVTAFGNYSMFIATSESAMLTNYHFYFEGAKLANGTNNSAYADAAAANIHENYVATKVTFNLNGHGANFDSYVFDGALAKPADPAAEGYEFGGWYEDAACTGTAVDFTTKTFSASTTLYAKWTPKPTAPAEGA